MKKSLFNLLVILSVITVITGCSINKKEDLLKGKWKATIEYQKDNRINKEKDDFILECNGKGLYDLRKNKEDLANANYTISKNNVKFYDESHNVLAICKLIDNKELDCNEKSYYAYKYIKIEE